MKKFLVGLDGLKTPDPAYWRARNEFIIADSAEEAKDIWCYMRGEWLQHDEVPFVQIREIPFDIITFPAHNYNFILNGIEVVKE